MSLEGYRAEFKAAERIHHTVVRRITANLTEISKPKRDPSWFYHWMNTRACKKNFGHCFHPESMVDWFCCICAKEVDGMPKQNCVFCNKED